METTYITIKDLASELGFHRSHCRKFVLSLGIETFPVRPPGTRGNPLIAVTQADAERVRIERRTRGFHIPSETSSTPAPNSTPTLPGHFYVIVLDPVARPNRLKFGYAQSVAARLADHRCAAPDAQLLGSWPAQRSWEPCIMAALSVGATRVGAEVFDVEDVDAVLGKAERFMGMLP